MSGANVRFSVSDSIARLTLDDRSSRLNLMSTRFLTELGEAIDSLAHRPNIAGLIVESAHSDMFSAGADIRELSKADPTNPAPTRTYVELALRIFDIFEALPYPTVAAIDGAALGGGFELALACDFRVCGSNPKLQIGSPEIKLGLIPGWGGTQRLPRLVGVEEAVCRILSGESYDATDPAPDDLVDETVPSDQLSDTAVRWLKTGDWREMRRIKRSPVPAHMLPDADFLAEIRHTLDDIDDPMKPAAAEALKVILEGSLSDLATGLRLETAAFLRLAGTENSRKLIAEFFAKRKK
jgi:enoyl-CoA hydratase/carnithine racemase